MTSMRAGPGPGFVTNYRKAYIRRRSRFNTTCRVSNCLSGSACLRRICPCAGKRAVMRRWRISRTPLHPLPGESRPSTLIPELPWSSVHKAGYLSQAFRKASDHVMMRMTRKQRCRGGEEWTRNRAGGGATSPVLPHHRTCGSVYDGACQSAPLLTSMRAVL